MIQENGCKNWQYWWKSEQQGENFSKEIDILVFKNDHSKWKKFNWTRTKNNEDTTKVVIKQKKE